MSPTTIFIAHAVIGLVLVVVGEFVHDHSLVDFGLGTLASSGVSGTAAAAAASRSST